MQSTVGPFFFGLFTTTFLLMIDVLYRYVDMFVSKGVPFTVATKVLILSLGFTLALSVPMSVLIAVLMGIGQLAGDNEITAMKTGGLSLWSVVRPMVLIGVLIGGALTAFNHWVYPESNHTLVNLLYDIRRSSPMMDIRERMFTNLNEHTTIFVESKNDADGRITGVSIIEKDRDGSLGPRITTAEWGLILPDPATNALILELHDGEIHDMPDPEQPTKYQITRFERQQLRLDDMKRDLGSSDRSTRGDREMNLSDLRDAARVQTDKQAESYQHVANLNAEVVRWQYNLLDPTARQAVLGNRKANPSERRTRFIATRRKLKHAATQSKAQSTILESHQRRANKYMVEFHKKLAIPFACVVFTLLGVPMAVTTSRSGKSVSISLAIGVYLIYYLCLLGGEKLSDRGFMDPALAMWSGNILLLGMGIPLFIRSLRESAPFDFSWLQVIRSRFDRDR